jgi:hypothetical protein
MGYDLVTWSPRAGSSGDDQHNPPEDTPVDAGDASGYSTIPAIAEINAGSGLNQVVALLNRRIKIHNATYGTATAALSYLAQGARPLASSINAINTAIDAQRVREGFAAYGAFDSSGNFAAGKTILTCHLADLRKALRIAGVMTLNNTSPQTSLTVYERYDQPYGTMLDESLAPTYPYGPGKMAPAHHVGNEYSLYRWRKIQNYPLHWFVQSIESAWFTFDMIGESHTLESFNVVVCLSAGSDYPTGLASAYNTDHVLAVIDKAVTGYQPVSITPSWIEGVVPGGHCSFIFGTDTEISDSGAGGQPYGAAKLATYDMNPVHLELDFGA